MQDMKFLWLNLWPGLSTDNTTNEDNDGTQRTINDCIDSGVDAKWANKVEAW